MCVCMWVKCPLPGIIILTVRVTTNTVIRDPSTSKSHTNALFLQLDLQMTRDLNLGIAVIEDIDL